MKVNKLTISLMAFFLENALSDVSTPPIELRNKCDALIDNCRTIQFKPEVDGALLRHQLVNVTVDTDTQCIPKCFNHQECVSYNVGPSPEKSDKFVCQLNRFDRVQKLDDFKVEMQGFRYADLKENHCRISPCLNNGTCQAGFGDRKYRCICLTGVTGENCETVTNKCTGNPCDPIGGECTSQIEGFTCRCKPGFIGNGSTCHGPGTSADLPGRTCKDIQTNYNTSTTGNYFIDADWSKDTQASQVYCDMETDRGGWTLVWSYNFFAPLEFTSNENRVKPNPSNMAKWGPKSSTTPTSETNYGAMNDTLWGYIGKEFLVKSNINNWISCIPQGGTLGPSWDHGLISCRIVKVIPGAKCSNVVPDNTDGDACGFMLNRGSNKCTFWETCSTAHWPIHDPCCNAQLNQDLLDAVSEPRGSIFLR